MCIRLAHGMPTVLLEAFDPAGVQRGGHVGEVLRALEAQVLEEVGAAGLAVALDRRAAEHGEVHGHRRLRGVGDEQELEPVGEAVLVDAGVDRSRRGPARRLEEAAGVGGGSPGALDSPPGCWPGCTTRMPASSSLCRVEAPGVPSSKQAIVRSSSLNQNSGSLGKGLPLSRA